MYEAFFSFRQRPFLAAPRVDRYFRARSIESGRQTLARAIERAEGVGVILGCAGIGKTLLCLTLAQELRASATVVMLACGRVASRRELLQGLLYELGLPYRGLDDGELRLSLYEHLGRETARPQSLVLLVDEADALSLKALDELRVLTNLMQDGQPQLRLVLSGSPKLDEHLAHAKLASLAQRVTARCHLDALDRRETAEYIRAQLVAAGGAADRIFDAGACDAVFEATDGVPRLVNQLCDHALVLAFAGGHAQLDAAGIEEAWADLQRLPAAWSERGRAPAAASHVIEFGELDDARPRASVAIDEFEPQTFVHAGASYAEAELSHLGMRLEPFTDHEASGLHAVAAVHDDEASEMLDDDFTPAGKIGPRDEMAAQPALDPFAEEFAVEEVVFDRYGTFDPSVLAVRARVHSDEGRLLAAALKPFLDETIAPRLRVAAHGAVLEPPIAAAVDDRATGAEPERVQPPPADLSSAVIETGPSALGHSVATVVACEAPLEAAPVEAAPLDAPSQAAHDEADRHIRIEAPSFSAMNAACDADHDIIIVDDDPASTPAAEQAAARRLEYRQLFAKLRRGV